MDEKILQIVNYAFLKGNKITESWISPERKMKKDKECRKLFDKGQKSLAVNQATASNKSQFRLWMEAEELSSWV